MTPEPVVCKLCNSKKDSSTFKVYNCECVLCKRCLKKHILDKIIRNEFFNMICPCKKANIPICDIRETISSDLWLRFINFRTNFNSKSMKKVCVNEKCNNEMEILINDDKKTTCPDCETTFCASCNVLWKPNHSCQNCPFCWRQIIVREKNDEYIKCKNIYCHTNFCWHCCNIYDGYFMLSHSKGCPNRNEFKKFAHNLEFVLCHIINTIGWTIKIITCPFWMPCVMLSEKLNKRKQRV